MKKRNLFFIVSLLILITPVVSEANSHEIKFKINGISDTSVILGYHFNQSLRPSDTAFVNKYGEGVFKGDEKLPGGMYFLFVNGAIFDFFLDKDQEFYLETDTSNLQGHLVVKGNEINEEWVDFQKKVDVINKKRDELMKAKEKTDEDGKEKIDEKLRDLGNQFSEIKWKTIEANEDNFLGIFLRATEEIKVPDPPKDENGNITDSLFQMRYYRNHFLDNIDYTDPRLIRTPIYEGKIKKYIEKVVPQIPDTLIVECDKLIDNVRDDEILFKYMLPTLFNIFVKSEIMGMDAVYIHLAEKYYLNDPKVDWSSEEFKKELEENVTKQKPLLLGKVIPNVEFIHVPSEHFKQALIDTSLRRDVFIGSRFKVHDLRADYIVLYFWEEDCGHCRKASPKLHEMTEKLQEMNTLVIAVHMMSTIEGKIKWVDFVNKNKMYNWINAWNPFSLEYKEKLDMRSTNQIYIIDKDKKIIAKRISPEQVETVIKAYIKKENKEKQNEE